MAGLKDPAGQPVAQTFPRLLAKLSMPRFSSD